MDRHQLRQPNAQALNQHQALDLLGMRKTNPGPLYRLCLKGKLGWIVTQDDRILIPAESLADYLDEQDAAQ